MRKLLIEQTAHSPRVIMDPENSIFELSGESRPHNAMEFYEEIIEWLDEFARHLSGYPGNNKPVVLNIDVEYFNSSSAKYLLDFFKRMANLRSMGTDVVIKWHYETNDFDMLEVGQEMSKLAKIPFEYQQKEN